MENKKMDRRVRKTRMQLRAGLTQLMREKPIKDITVRELAQLVDINRCTFYLHYRDIYDMVEQVEQEVFDEFEEIVKSYSPEDLEARPLSLLLALFEFEAPTCLKQLNEIACTVATWVEIAVIGPQIECDTGNQCPAVFVGNVGVGAQQQAFQFDLFWLPGNFASRWACF